MHSIVIFAKLDKYCTKTVTSRKIIFNQLPIFFFLLQNYCEFFSNSLAWLYSATKLTTIDKLQAWRFKSDMFKDKDQHQNFCKKQSICHYQENVKQKSWLANMLSKYLSNALNNLVFFFVWTIIPTS